MKTEAFRGKGLTCSHRASQVVSAVALVSIAFCPDAWIELHLPFKPEFPFLSFLYLLSEYASSLTRGCLLTYCVCRNLSCLTRM